MCIHDKDEGDGDPYEEEEPYRYCEVYCFACKNGVARFTERTYTSDYGVTTRDDCYYNLGSHCSVTECCHGAICFRCAFREDIFCNFCKQQTNVAFLNKDSYGYFSEKTDSLNTIQWLDLIYSFHLLRENLGRDCHLFFLWLNKHYKGCLWTTQINSWHILAKKANRICQLMKEFEKFLLAIASKMVTSQTFFSNIHQIEMINPPFFAEITSKRQHLLPAFLEACYNRLPITRRQMIKETQVAIVGTLAVRLSHNQKQFAKLIFSRIMLNLLLLKN